MPTKRDYYEVLGVDRDAGADEIAHVVYLSNLIGADVDLVQPGGGNTSVKLEEDDVFGKRVTALAVKGSGTDLRTITADGFTHLYSDRLAALRDREGISGVAEKAARPQE